jgi:hypothetical protein
MPSAPLLVEPGLEHQDCPQLVLPVPSALDVLPQGGLDRLRVEEAFAFEALWG